MSGHVYYFKGESVWSHSLGTTALALATALSEEVSYMRHVPSSLTVGFFTWAEF